MGLVPDNPPATGPGLYLGPRCDRCCAPPAPPPPHGYTKSFAEKAGSGKADPPWHSAVTCGLKSVDTPPPPELTCNVTPLGVSLILLYDGAMPLTVVLIKRRHQQLNSND